tara:strand:- start:239 stop:604 length:366 start_codon:yes stop_codon:yes gene_type:complete
MGVFIKEGNGMSFNEAIENLMENIKKDYCKWSSHEKMIKEFKEKVRFTRGRKYTKILNGNSVWGFIANGNGVMKGIPYKQGDVFMAATWRGPAKHVRGNIFAKKQNYFRWTGPDYIWRGKG